MSHLQDPNFQNSVVILCEHSEDGALGLVVNRPTPYLLGQVYEGQGIEGRGGREQPVHYGGPVQPEMGFVLYEGEEREGSVAVTASVHLSTSLQLLKEIAAEQGPAPFLFCLGYAGWAPDQLEGEIARNDWLVVPSTKELLFEVPAELRWERAIRSLGIDPVLLSQGFGTA